MLVQKGHLGRGGAVALGVLGAIVGNQLGYWVGHGAGRELVLTWRRYVKLTPGRPEWVEGLFARHGGKAVFAGRFFSALRASLDINPVTHRCYEPGRRSAVL